MSNAPTIPKLENFDVVKDWMHVLGKQTTTEKQQDVANKQQPSGFVDRNHYKSMGSLQPTPEAYDKKLASAKVAQSLKNPFEAPNPQLQLVSHGAKLNRLMADPRYQGLNDNLKLTVLHGYYKKYTEPILKANGVEPPGFDNWIRGQHSEIYNDPDRGKSEQTIKSEFVSGVTEGTADLTKLIRNSLRYAIPPISAKQNGKPLDLSGLNDFAKGLNTLNQSYNSTFQTDHSFSGWLANTAGHVVGEGPAYVLLDTLTAGVAPSLEVLSKTAPRTAKAIKFMKEGGEIFAVDKGEGKDTKTASSDAILGPLIGFGLRGATGVVRRGFNKAGEQILNQVNAKGTQLAVMGKPFANTVEAVADEKEQYLLGEGQKLLGGGEKPKAQSFVNKSSADIQQAANNERALREAIARKYYGHKINPDSPDASIWRNLSKDQRGHVKQYIREITNLSAETMPLTSPHVQTLANENEIEQFIKEHPEQDKDFKAIAKLTGLNPAEALTEVQAENIAGHLGINTPTQHLNEAFNGAMENPEPKGVSGGSGLKSGHTVSYNQRIDNATTKDIVSSNGEEFINKTMKYLEDAPSTKNGKVYFEHPEHHLLQIAENSKAPTAVKNKAVGFLAREFGHDPLTIKNRAAWLKEHVDDLRRTGLLNSQGNIYRSTKLQQRRYGTTWQKELYTADTLNAQMAQLQTLMKQNAKLKAVIKPMLKQLIAIKNKSATPEKLGIRASSIDSMIESLKGMR